MTRLEALQAAKLAFSQGRLADGAIYKAEFAGVGRHWNGADEMKAVADYRSEVDLNELAQLSPDSFGHHLYQFMHRNQLMPFVVSAEFPESVLARNLFGYRYAVTHDMFHVLLGYDTSLSGEMGVLAFAAAQGYSKMQRYVAFPLALIFYILFSPFSVRRTLRNARLGWRQGQQARFLLGRRLEDDFEVELPRLRQVICIEEWAHENEGNAQGFGI